MLFYTIAGMSGDLGASGVSARGFPKAQGRMWGLGDRMGRPMVGAFVGVTSVGTWGSTLPGSSEELGRMPLSNVPPGRASCRIYPPAPDPCGWREAPGEINPHYFWPVLRAG